MKSILAEWHAYRGFKTGSDLFDNAWVAGFVTFYVSKESVADSIREMKRRLEKAKHVVGRGLK